MALPPGFVDALERVLGPDGVIREPEQLRTYECDGLTGYRVVPALVVLPRTAEQVQGALRICHDNLVPFVARGAGTGLSGGALPVADGIVISLARMNRVLETDIEAGQGVVEAGGANLDVSRAVAAGGFFCATVPSAPTGWPVCGNVAAD